MLLLHFLPNQKVTGGLATSAGQSMSDVQVLMGCPTKRTSPYGGAMPLMHLTVHVAALFSPRHFCDFFLVLVSSQSYPIPPLCDLQHKLCTINTL